MERFLAEKAGVKSIIDPVDFNTAANTGNRIDMKDVKRVTFLVTAGAGTSTTTHSFALKQHLVASSGSPATLSSDNPYYHKVGAATSFTKVDRLGVAAHTLDLHTLLADSKFVVAIEVLAEELNRADSYRWVSLDVADTGGAQIGTCIAIVEGLNKPAYAIAL